MLVISRKKGESLLIGDDIEITVEKIDISSVKISIKAPKEKVILRKEVYEKVKDENSNAIATTKDILKILKLRTTCIQLIRTIYTNKTL